MIDRDSIMHTIHARLQWILGFIELAEQEPDPDKKAKYFARARKEIDLFRKYLDRVIR